VDGLFTLAFTAPAPTGLSTPPGANSPAHYTGSTRSPLTEALTDCWLSSFDPAPIVRVTDLIELGFLSIAVLCTIGHARLLGLEDGPPVFTQGISNPTLLSRWLGAPRRRGSLQTLFRLRLQGVRWVRPASDRLNRARSPLLPVSRLISVAGY